VSCTTEDEQPVHLPKSAQLDLPERTSLLQPPKQQGDILPINIIVPMKSRFTILFIVSVRPTHSVAARRLVMHLSYERSGNGAQAAQPR